MSADELSGLSRDALKKLQMGLERLERADDDPVLLGSALTSLHGALEDATRAKLAGNPLIPKVQRDSILDRQKVTWMQLIELLERYENLGRSERQIILRANTLRQGVAHGDDYEGTREEIEEYAYFVQARVNSKNSESSILSSSLPHRSNLNVPCPCGAKCKGADRLGRAPICFRAYSGNDMPRNFRRELYKGASFLGVIGRSLAMGFIEATVTPLYEVYECPSCGCEVLFVSYETSGGSRIKRAGDNSSC